MYDRLKGGVEVLEDDTLNQKFLIDFQVKCNRKNSYYFTSPGNRTTKKSLRISNTLFTYSLTLTRWNSV